jgi:CDP-6-deoxy-D-xylo-4-hexulose-3-dehydrase
MLVHVLGLSTDMTNLLKILKRNKIILIEDTCESIGAKYNKHYLGTFGDFSTFSFYFSHQISSVEGGMICCKSQEDEDIIKSLRSHGWAKGLSNQKQIEKKFNKMNNKFLFVNSGFKFRPPDIQAAIGLSQFKSLDDFIKIRKTNRDNIIGKLKTDKRWKNQVDFIYNKDCIKPSWFGLTMLLNKKYKNNRNKIFNKLDKLGIENRPIISGNFLKQPALRKYNLKQKSESFPEANFVHEHGLFVGLKNKILKPLETKKFINIFFKAFKV